MVEIWLQYIYHICTNLFNMAIFFLKVLLFFSVTESFFASVFVRKSVLCKSWLRVIIFRSQRRRRTGSRIHLLARDKGIRRMPRGGFSRDTNGYERRGVFKGWPGPGRGGWIFEGSSNLWSIPLSPLSLPETFDPLREVLYLVANSLNLCQRQIQNYWQNL